MDEYASLSHTKWDCKYHIVFIPKCRKRVLYKTLRQHLSEVFGDLAQQRECKIEEGHLMSDHVHILISIPPNYAVSQVVGYIKGKSAIHLARTYGEHLAKFPANCKMCQGTTLVVPEEQQNLVGLSPCSFVFSYLQFRSF